MTKNFNINEFKCKCGKCDVDELVYSNIVKVANNLQILRDYLNTPIRINSAYRCVLHNRRIGGSKYSQHILGKAVDITADGYTPDEVYEAVQKLRRDPRLKPIRFQGIGRYNTFTHLDIRDNYTTWDNRK